MLVVPMRYDETTVGVITLSKLGLDGFDDVDLRVLTILADQAATAVESARLLARSQDLARELRRLLDMSGELSESLDPRQVANLMARHLANAMTVDECAISYWDRASGRVESLGYWPPLRLEEMEPYFLVSGFPETLRTLERQETVIIDTEDPAADPAEVALLTRDGNRMLVMLPLVAKGQSIGLVELFSRSLVTWPDERLELARTMANEAAMALENARLYEDARKLADRDPLTGFYNHRFLHERLGEEVVRAQRARRPLSVLMLDLDDFKLVNDTFGHLFGDRVLTFTAELIRSTLRVSDVGARYGGDEFAVILPETDADDARHTADRILEAFRDNPFVGEQRGPVPLAASIGVATFPADGRTATDLIAAADAALYAVKRAGGHGTATARDGDAGLTIATGRRSVRKYYLRSAIRTGPGCGRDASGPASCIPDVSEPPKRRSRPVDPSDRRIRRSWLVFAGSFILLIVVALARVLTSGATALDWLLLVLIAVAGGAAVTHAVAVAGMDARQRVEVESFARILSGLSRSVSADAIVDAIVEELGHATGADHIVVVRRRPDTRVLEARLVSSRVGIPDSVTLLPIADLEDPLPAGHANARTAATRAGRPHRPPRANGLRPHERPRRAPDRWRRRGGRDRPLAAVGATVAGGDPAHPWRRRAGGIGVPGSRVLASGRRGSGRDGRPDRTAEPPLLRRVRLAAGAASAGWRRGRDPDGGHRQVQGAQRHARARDRR